MFKSTIARISKLLDYRDDKKKRWRVGNDIRLLMLILISRDLKPFKKCISKNKEQSSQMGKTYYHNKRVIESSVFQIADCKSKHK